MKLTEIKIPPADEILATMREVSAVYMADNNNIEYIRFGKKLDVRRDYAEGDFKITDSKEIISWEWDKQDAINSLEELCTDDIEVKGFGKWSGRRFWQLPRKLRKKIVKLAKA